MQKLLRSKILEEAIVTEIYHRTECKKLIAFLSVALKKKVGNKIEFDPLNCKLFCI